MAKGVIVRSDYSDKNLLMLLKKDDGDIIITTQMNDKKDKTIGVATLINGSKLFHSGEVRKHLSAIIDLLSDGKEKEDIVKILQ